MRSFCTDPRNNSSAYFSWTSFSSGTKQIISFLSNHMIVNSGNFMPWLCPLPKIPLRIELHDVHQNYYVILKHAVFVVYLLCKSCWILVQTCFFVHVLISIKGEWLVKQTWWQCGNCFIHTGKCIRSSTSPLAFLIFWIKKYGNFGKKMICAVPKIHKMSIPIILRMKMCLCEMYLWHISILLGYVICILYLL